MNIDSSKSKPTRKRRFLRFSILRLLILIAIIGGIFGLWARAVYPLQQQWRTVRPLIKQGARVETKPSQVPDWIKKFLPEGETENIDAIYFRNKESFTSKDLECLKHLPFLERLYVQCCGLSDADIETVSKHRPLRRLAIWHNPKLTNACVANLQKLKNLEIVDVKNTSINSRGIADLRSNPSLNVVFEARKANFCDADLEEMAAQFGAEAREISIHNSSATTIQRAVKRFPKVRRIEVDHWSALSDSAIKLFSSDQPWRLNIEILNADDADDPWWDTVFQHFKYRTLSFRSEGRRFIGFRNRSDSSVDLRIINRSNAKLKDLSQRDELSKIRSALVYGSDFSEASPLLPYFRGLETLKLKYLKDTNFSGWKGNDKLQTINFSRCFSLKEIEGLEKFDSLDSLKVDITPRLESISVANGNEKANLKHIYMYLGATSVFRHNFGALNSLETVRIYPRSKPGDLSWLSNNPALRKVYIGRPVDLQILENIRNVPSLEIFEIKNAGSLSKFKNIQFPATAKLILNRLPALTGFSCFEGVEGLRDLEICGAENWKSCQQATRLPDLRVLHLGWLDILESINGLEKLNHLKSLHLDDFPAIESGTDPDVLTKLKNQLEQFEHDWNPDE